MVGTNTPSMKRILLILAIFAGLATKAQQATDNSPKEELIISKESHDFGKIPQGRPVTTYFELTNKTKAAIKLDNVQASCGCTTPEWSKESIAPGATTKIKVGYNAAAEGPFQKTITVQYNGTATRLLTISGTVYKPTPASAPANHSLSILQQVKEN